MPNKRKSQYCLSELASYLEADWIGDAEFLLNGIASLELASKQQLSFLAQKKYQSNLEISQAGAVIVKERCDTSLVPNQIICADPYEAYAKVSALFATLPQALNTIHPTAIIHPSATIGNCASIGPNCVVEENVEIGEHCRLMPGVFVGARSKIGAHGLIHPNITIYHDVLIGARVVIHSGTVIGSDGFGFAPVEDGWKKIHQLGGVRIGDDVEIGSNTSIDRGALTDTVVEDGVILDNQVHLAHNVKIGKHSAIAARVAIAGSTIVGERCTMGGCVAVNGHISIVDDVHLNGGTVVTKSIVQSGVYASGTPMQGAKQWRRNYVRMGQLDEWVARIKKLEDKSG